MPAGQVTGPLVFSRATPAGGSAAPSRGCRASRSRRCSRCRGGRSGRRSGRVPRMVEEGLRGAAGGAPGLRRPLEVIDERRVGRVAARGAGVGRDGREHREPEGGGEEVARAVPAAQGRVGHWSVPWGLRVASRRGRGRAVPGGAGGPRRGGGGARAPGRSGIDRLWRGLRRLSKTYPITLSDALDLRTSFSEGLSQGRPHRGRDADDRQEEHEQPHRRDPSRASGNRSSGS